MDSTCHSQLLALVKEHAYFRQKITLSSGKESDYYIDARRVTLMSRGAYLAARLMLERVQDLDYDAIGGPTLGADPLIGAVGVLNYQNETPKPMFIIRKASKSHGRQQLIEGPDLKEGARVVLIDDVATTGKAFLHSIAVLREKGFDPVQCLCVVDRKEGAAEAVAEAGSQLESLLDINDIHSPAPETVDKRG